MTFYYFWYISLDFNHLKKIFYFFFNLSNYLETKSFNKNTHFSKIFKYSSLFSYFIETSLSHQNFHLVMNFFSRFLQIFSKIDLCENFVNKEHKLKIIIANYQFLKITLKKTYLFIKFCVQSLYYTYTSNYFNLYKLYIYKNLCTQTKN